MSQKAESNHPTENQKNEQDITQQEEEFVEFTEKIFKNPTIINTFPSEQFETPTTPKHVQKRNSIFFKKKSTKDERYEAHLLEEAKMEKKVFLKNYSKEVVKDAKAREDYLVLFAFVSLSGNNIPLFNELRDRSAYLSSLVYTVTPKELLDVREFISQVLIAAANQREDTVIKEIIKNENFGYIVTLQIVLAFVKNDLHGLLKPLLKVADTHHKSSLKVLSNFIQQNSPKRKMQKKESSNSDSSHPLQLRRTLVNMSRSGNNADDYSVSKKPLFDRSALSDNESLLNNQNSNQNQNQNQNPTNKSLKSMTSGGDGPKIEKQPTQEKEFFVSRAPPAKSAYNNVTIECKFENILPYMIQYEKLDVIDVVIDAFGENKVNHLTLLILHTQEAAALKYYKKRAWDLTENQAIMLCNKKMWNFLCNIDDELDKNIFFSDNVFANMREIGANGKVLTELVVFFMTLPLNSWRQNQAVALMELASSLLKDDPDINRLVYANNPILTCAQLSFLLERLSRRFRFIQNDLVALSLKMANLAYNLQNSYRENNLYSLYLKTLPTGLTMLDYILQMGMKNLVETKFTKGLVLELWDNDSLVTGSKKEISTIYNAVNVNKKFSWKPKITTKVTENFSFEFGNMTTSAKYLLYLDLAYLAFLYIVVDIYIYTKVDFLAAMESNPDAVYSLKPYYLDSIYQSHPGRTIFTVIVLFNYWFFFLVRTIYIFRQSIGSATHRVGYLFTLLFVTLTLISLGMFPSYESQIKYATLMKLILVFTRTSIAYLFGNSMLGFQRSGQTITVVATVTTSLLMILAMLLAYMLFIGEIMNNFFHDIYFYGTVPEAFFSLVEILFGSITFINFTDVPTNHTLYYTANFFILIYSFTSTILATFLLIAYLSSTYEATRNEASYLNTQTQYYYIQIFTRIEWKGFYAFPPLLIPFVVPFMFLHRVQRLSESVNLLLLKIRYFLVWVTFQILKYLVVNSFYYAPVLYIKNLYLLAQGKTTTKGSNLLQFIYWGFAGPFMIGYYMVIDIKTLLEVMMKDWSITLPREKLLLRVTDDDVIYIQRYESLREGFNNIMKENPEIQIISYLELLNYLMNGWKVTNSEIPKSVLIKKETTKQRLPDLIRKHQKRLGGSKWLKSIYDAKKRFYKELLDGFLNYKTRSMKVEDSTIDPRVALDILQEVSEENIVYLRARQIFAIQFVLLNTQSKENISTMNKIDELDKKIDKLFKIYFAQYGTPQDFKWSKIIRSTTDVGMGGGNYGATMNNVDQNDQKANRAMILGTAVT